jgi:ribosomal protein S12 methylthiotransferase
MKLVYIVSLGCVKNLVDTEIASGSLIVNSIGLTQTPEEADVYFINTCSFIQSARDEAEEVIEEAAAWKKNRKNGRIIVAGCLVNWDRHLIFKQKHPEVDAWIHSDDITKLADIINSFDSSDTSLPVTESEHLVQQHEPEYIYNEKTPRIQLTLPHIAYLKIADGCNNNCTYCTIPFIRGKLRCRTLNSVIKEAKNLIANGVKELILIAQDLAAFNIDSEDENLAALLTRLDALEGDFMIRLLYIHPCHLTEEIIDIIADSKHIYHYLDLPVQHISDRILKAMNRKISNSEITEKLKYIRTQIPDAAIRTTFITGFPGETDEDFNILKNFIEEMQFTRAGFFTYFREPGTPAASLQNQIPHETALIRKNILEEIQKDISLKFNRKLVGKKLSVTIDGFLENGAASARSYMDAPEVDNIILIQNSQNLTTGCSYNVIIKAADENTLFASAAD